MPYQCSEGSAKNKCRTSNGLDLFSERKDGNNQIVMWLDSHAKKRNMSYPIQNSMTKLRKSGSVAMSRTIKEENVSTEWLTSAKLLKCIQSEMNNEKNGNNLAVRGVWIEGMHRGLKLFNQALGAQYNEGTGISVLGSMAPEYLKKGLQNYYMQMEAEMKTRGYVVSHWTFLKKEWPREWNMPREKYVQ